MDGLDRELMLAMQQPPFGLNGSFYQGRRLVLYGAGRLGDLAIKILAKSGLSPAFFIDINASSKPELKGYKVYPPEKLGTLDPQNDVVMICAFKFPYKDIRQQVKKWTNAEIYSIYDLFFFLKEAHFSNGWQAGPLSEEDQYHIKEVFRCLSDEISKRTYLSFVQWRVARIEGDNVQNNLIDEKNKYFNELTKKTFDRNGAVIDGGAFDLTFSLEVVEKYPSVTKVYALEPDNESQGICAAAINSGNADKRIELHRVAVSNRIGQMPFVHGHGLASRLTEADDQNVGTAPATTLDGLQGLMASEGPVIAVKLHVEGHERQALEGARRLIKAQRPLLMVNCSHNRDGLWRIPFECMRFNGYSFYMRQHAYYGEGLTFYAVPD